jgi:hypothetical protein
MIEAGVAVLKTKIRFPDFYLDGGNARELGLSK